MADEPIEEPDYLSGVTVVDIGDLRVARGLTRRPVSSCRHARLNYDPRERRIWCKDCEKDIDAFEAFTGLVEQYHYAYSALTRQIKEVDEAKQFQARSLAVKNLDAVWRKRNYVPACPHCKAGLFPEDFAKGVGAILSRDYAMARRNKGKK